MTSESKGYFIVLDGCKKAAKTTKYILKRKTCNLNMKYFIIFLLEEHSMLTKQSSGGLIFQEGDWKTDVCILPLSTAVN